MEGKIHFLLDSKSLPTVGLTTTNEVSNGSELPSFSTLFSDGSLGRSESTKLHLCLEMDPQCSQILFLSFCLDEGFCLVAGFKTSVMTPLHAVKDIRDPN